MYFNIFPWVTLEVLHVANDNRTFVSFEVFMQVLPVICKIYGLVDFLSLWVATFCLCTEVMPILLKIECLRAVRLGLIRTLLMKVYSFSFRFTFSKYKYSIKSYT